MINSRKIYAGSTLERGKYVSYPDPNIAGHF
jgi:hypothetical protein